MRNRRLLGSGRSREAGRSWARLPGRGLRELKEETGVDAELIGLIDVIDTVREDEQGRIQFHYTLVDFAAIWTSGEPLANDDVSDAQWVHLLDLENKGLWSETIRVIREAVMMRDGRRG